MCPPFMDIVSLYLSFSGKRAWDEAAYRAGDSNHFHANLPIKADSTNDNNLYNHLFFEMTSCYGGQMKVCNMVTLSTYTRQRNHMRAWVQFERIVFKVYTSGGCRSATSIKHCVWRAPVECLAKWRYINSIRYFQPINVNSSKYSINDDNKTRQLSINNVSASDEGVYSCTVQNKQTAAKLYVSRE